MGGVGRGRQVEREKGNNRWKRGRGKEGKCEIGGLKRI